MQEKHDNSTPVHVLMAAYNSAQTIQIAMASALNQTHQNITLIICDDGSTDDTQKQIQNYLQKHPEHKDKVILEKNEKNEGISQTRQTLLSRSTEHNKNAYLLWLDSDDQYTDLDFIKPLIKQMQVTGANIGLFNYSIVYGANIPESSKFGLEADRENSVSVLEKIFASKDKTVCADTFPDILKFTSFGCTKCYAPSVFLPTPADYPFEDFVYMTALLHAAKITAFEPQKQPFQYTRHSTSICGQRLPENFTVHIPKQLIRFYEIAKQRYNESIHLNLRKRLTLAEHYIEDTLSRYGKMLEILIQEKQPGFSEQTLEEFKRARKKVIAQFDRIYEGKSTAKQLFSKPQKPRGAQFTPDTFPQIPGTAPGNR